MYDRIVFPEPRWLVMTGFLSSLKEPKGGIMHVWRDQGWFVNMFEIASNDPVKGSVEFATWTDAEGLDHPVGVRPQK